MSAAEDVRNLFAKMPESFLPEQAGNLNATIQMELSGEGGGNWAIKIANGSLKVVEEKVASPDLTLGMEASDYVALSRGEVNPMNLFMAGKIQVQGDMSLAMKFQEIFDLG